MYTGIVQRVQRLEIIFNDDDFDGWKKQNPHMVHTHDNYIKEIAESFEESPDLWATYEQDIICILYNNGRE